MADKRGIAVLGARTASGIVAVAVAAVAVVGALTIEWPTVGEPSAGIRVQPVPAVQQRVCPGPLYTLALDAAIATAASSIGRASVAASDNVDDSSDLAVPDNSLGDEHDGPRLLSVSVPEGATAPPLMAASQSQTANTETDRGLAVAACTVTSATSWLVGGSSDIGRTSLIILNNPSTVQATVDLTVWGETGRVDAPGATGIIVPPGAQRVVSLAGLAPNLKSPVVRVDARGGLVQATIQQSIIRGLTPGGVEIIAATRNPDLQQIISGITIVPVPLDGVAADHEDELHDDQPAMRLFIPGEVDATVDVLVTADGGATAGTSMQLKVPAGVATEVPLTGLVAGTYTVEVRSDLPAVVAAKSSVQSPEAQDFAWFTASAPIDSDFLVVPAKGPSPTMHAVNSSETDAATLVLSAPGIADTTVEVAPGDAVSVPLKAELEYSVAVSGGGVVASVSYAAAGVSSSFALQPTSPLVAPLTIYTH